MRYPLPVNGRYVYPEELDFDPSSATVGFNGRRVRLSITAILLLKALSQKSCTFDDMANLVNSGRKGDGSSYRTLTVMIHNLRKKVATIDLGIARVSRAEDRRKGEYRVCTPPAVNKLLDKIPTTQGSSDRSMLTA